MDKLEGANLVSSRVHVVKKLLVLLVGELLGWPHGSITSNTIYILLQFGGEKGVRRLWTRLFIFVVRRPR